MDRTRPSIRRNAENGKLLSVNSAKDSSKQQQIAQINSLKLERDALIKQLNGSNKENTQRNNIPSASSNRNIEHHHQAMEYEESRTNTAPEKQQLYYDPQKYFKSVQDKHQNNYDRVLQVNI